jgi:SEC-C motif
MNTCTDCSSELKHQRRDFGSGGWMESLDCPQCRRPVASPVENTATPLTYECPPLEHTDPGLAEFFRLVATKQHPTVRGCNLMAAVHSFRLKDGRTVHNQRPLQAVKVPGRNDPCSCGSGLKFKKCCGK